jgi:hypothetical protein
MEVKGYWWRAQPGRPLIVNVRAITTHRFAWSMVRGVQIGPWFVGVIKGTAKGVPQPRRCSYMIRRRRCTRDEGHAGECFGGAAYS